MENINGKILIFTDLHLGLKNASKTRLAICINVIKKIITYIKENNITSVIFCGDWNHVRTTTENNVLNISYKLMSALAKVAKVYCLIGNHDIYLKNSTDITSLVIFKNIQNVKIIDRLQKISINGNLSLFVPWLADLTNEQKETYDMIFGHFDVSHKYLIKSYIEDNSRDNCVSNNIINQIKNDNLLQTTNNTQQNAGDYIGDFVDIVKKNGIIFSGHIHSRREFLAKSRKFIFIGSPYQQNLGEINNKCGFYTINEENKYEFHEIIDIPKHIELRMSNIIKNIDTFDFSIIKNNIIHKIYDIEVDNITDAKISQYINDWKPYEELLPDYDVDLSTNKEIQLQNESIELIKKSKLDYIQNYINNIDQNILIKQNIDKHKLYNILEKYYNYIIDKE